MFASTSAKLLAQLTKRFFCSCAPRPIQKLPGVGKEPVYIPPAEKKKTRKNASANPRKKAGKNQPETELFAALGGKSAINHRPTLINEDSCRDLVRAWGIDKMHDAVVLEPYAGPGGLTRALLELPNVKRVIAVEEAVRYIPLLKAAKDSLRDPERLSVIKHDPFSWEAYSNEVAQAALADVPTVGWDKVHPNLFLACQMPNTRFGEQLFVQFMSTSASKMWLWQKGRFQMGFNGPDAFWTKLSQPPGTATHHKLAVQTAALCDIEPTQLMTPFAPADAHYHRPRGDPAIFSPVLVTPHANHGIDNFDAFEYVVTRMFVSKGVSWKKGIASVTSGAANLIPEMIRQGVPDSDIKVNELERDHWVVIANVFNDWPFRPESLFDEHNFHPSEI